MAFYDNVCSELKGNRLCLLEIELDLGIFTVLNILNDYNITEKLLYSSTATNGGRIILHVEMVFGLWLVQRITYIIR